VGRVEYDSDDDADDEADDGNADNDPPSTQEDPPSPEGHTYKQPMCKQICAETLVSPEGVGVDTPSRPIESAFTQSQGIYQADQAITNVRTLVSTIEEH
jgi:hypothetical protein